jgi:pantoate--beta-alanine ligase
VTVSYRQGEVTVHERPAELGKVTRALRASGRIPGVVVCVSVFVNPLQFGPNEDLSRYPRPFESDVDMCRREGVGLIFHPSVEDMYPHGGARVTIDPGALGAELEGASRPGHFNGVLTVVAKLFNIVRPEFAFFGEKDYQQLVLVRRMVADLDLDVRVVGVPTVREEGGLARSSRNAYLDATQREAALALSAALSAGAHAGIDGADAIMTAARDVLANQPGVTVDYLELRAGDLGPAPERGQGRLLVAARVGATRLIDNIPVLVVGEH